MAGGYRPERAFVNKIRRESRTPGRSATYAAPVAPATVAVERLRASAAAGAIRTRRLVVVLRRVSPRERLVALVEDLADAGARIFEITFDAPSASDDLVACRTALAKRGDDFHFGAGTIRDVGALEAAADAGASFAVSPVLDPRVLESALALGVPFVPGALSPTEIDAAWRAGATFVKVFPASSVGPSHLREIRGPLPEVQLIPTGGVDGDSAPQYLAAGAVAVGIGGALVNAVPEARRAIVAAVEEASR
jgi:2-dehydro-3-deoxyphosphogluconate aldolase/(4S)-4-hydroxy-2-oxoglutarate aldolase